MVRDRDCRDSLFPEQFAPGAGKLVDMDHEGPVAIGDVKQGTFQKPGRSGPYYIVEYGACR